jgi:hypothetical protein
MRGGFSDFAPTQDLDTSQRCSVFEEESKAAFLVVIAFGKLKKTIFMRKSVMDAVPADISILRTISVPIVSQAADKQFHYLYPQRRGKIYRTGMDHLCLGFLVSSDALKRVRIWP